MDQIKMGNFIAKRRKEKQLTQAGLGEKLGVSDKSVSKWERGQCQPNSALFPDICNELDITVSELFAGEKSNDANSGKMVDESLIEIVKIYEKIKLYKNVLIGAFIFIVALVLKSLKFPEENLSDVGLFFNGFINGLSTGAVILGILIAVYNLVKISRQK